MFHPAALNKSGLPARTKVRSIAWLTQHAAQFLKNGFLCFSLTCARLFWPVCSTEIPHIRRENSALWPPPVSSHPQSCLCMITHSSGNFKSFFKKISIFFTKFYLLFLSICTNHNILYFCPFFAPKSAIFPHFLAKKNFLKIFLADENQKVNISCPFFPLLFFFHMVY